MKQVLSTFVAALLLVASQAAAVAQQTKAAEKKAPAAAAAAAAGTTAAKGAAKEVPMSERCIGKTKDGDQCKRKAAEGKKYCWQHDPNRKAKTAKKS